ncbi:MULTISPECIES: hypothetical protein [Rahnella]|jgi:hypothetical protein|uniref:Uncharacterized protein n=1 Tax=Rahnella contaminans TaxID=2703882 RepID=A0A6M2AXH0_9GAMM|nr:MULTISPECIES: hypothetical protein [Rahnella]KAB8308766.1 hypothetical protein EH227_12560 [Rouxiella chamberiensis]MBU9819452.1 hypothetical protein [Rahnella sp. BCC 1045]MCS3421662.1 hypothetical protein [Rahnella sp. BIGb0603]MDF1893658.1 hypothetical protein [Rahnella contaminans]NGX85645.1 hypothetical protein [Rahnella contaminans]
MLKNLLQIFSSPEQFLGLFSAKDIENTLEEGERILIDENGTASVNPANQDMQEDFARHVKRMGVL